MLRNRLLKEACLIKAGFVDQAAGTSEVKTATVDMLNYDWVAFLVFVGDSTSGSVVTYAVKANTADSTTSPTPVAVPLNTVSAGALTSGNLVTTAGAGDIDDKIIVIWVKKSQIPSSTALRYAFLSVTPATQNTAFNGCLILAGNSASEPVTASSDVYAFAEAADGVN